MRLREKVIVKTTVDSRSKQLIPERIFWRGKNYSVKKIGLHHSFRRGRELIHVFSVLAEGSFFRLELESETLQWSLVEVVVEE